MTAVSIARFLTDFDPAGDAAPARPVRGRPPADDEGTLRAQARAQGEAVGRAAAERDATQRMEALTRQHEAQLAAARAAWVEAEGSRLSEQMRLGLEHIETAISDAAARILLPLLAEPLRRQTVAELAAAIRAVVANAPDAAVAVNVSGPDDLLAALQAKLGSGGPTLRTTTAPGCDLTVQIEQTVLETTLGAWRIRLEEAMA